MDREKLTAVAYVVGPAWDERLPLGQQTNALRHMRFMRELQDSGQAIMAGPHWLPSEIVDGQAVGILVLRAEPGAAQEIVGKDPAVAGGQLRAVVRPFYPLPTAQPAGSGTNSSSR